MYARIDLRSPGVGNRWTGASEGPYQRLGPVTSPSPPDEGVRRFTGGHIVMRTKSDARSGYAHEDTYWTTFVRDETDLEAIENESVAHPEMLQTRDIETHRRIEHGGRQYVGAGGAQLGSMDSGDQPAIHRTEKTPWEPAQPWMKANLQSGDCSSTCRPIRSTPSRSRLSKPVRRHRPDEPTDCSGPMGVANGLMGSSYQRQKGGAWFCGRLRRRSAARRIAAQQHAAGVPNGAEYQAHGLLNWDAMKPV